MKAETAHITPGFEKPPYRVETLPIGSCVLNADGVNVLSFTCRPGAKFTTAERAQATCDNWNASRAAP